MSPQVKTWYEQYLTRRQSAATTLCSSPLANRSSSVLQLPPQVKTWYVQYLMRRQMPGVCSEQDKVPFFKALMSGEVGAAVEH
jgi:hypothetical protein